MDTSAQKDLRDQLGERVRRVEADKSLLVTVAGHPVAELLPTSPRRWVSGESLAAIWKVPPGNMADDLALLSSELVDPFHR